MRTVELLPFVPTTWIAREALLRAAEHGQQPAHAVQAEPHAEQLERERCSSARYGRSSQLLQLLAQARELVALGLHDGVGRWRRSARWRACPRRGRSPPPGARGARSRAAQPSASRSTRRGREDGDASRPARRPW